jgi:phosphatidylserine/phosphatidylglycerophosphate/cardiolipin synthase-like enzyme
MGLGIESFCLVGKRESSRIRIAFYLTKNKNATIQGLTPFTHLIHSHLFERILCPRIHTKAIIIDGTHAFIGSANLTGAGLGAKSPHKRNFEAGFLTNDPAHLTPMMEWIDQLYLGDFCQKCARRAVCPDPIA